MTITPQIPCPDCGVEIAFDTALLMAGEGFTCTGCGIEIRLDTNEKTKVQDIKQQFEALQARIAANDTESR